MISSCTVYSTLTIRSVLQPTVHYSNLCKKVRGKKFLKNEEIKSLVKKSQFFQTVTGNKVPSLEKTKKISPKTFFYASAY